MKLLTKLMTALFIFHGAAIGMTMENSLDLTEQKRQTLLNNLFKQLNPSSLGKKYIEILKNNDETAKIHYIAHYFRNRPDTSYSTPANFAIADAAVDGEVEIVNIPWKFPNGHINFLFNPTQTKGPLNNEWLWQLNRHMFWRDMAGCYLKTNNPKYAKAFNSQLRDWIMQTDCPEKWNATGSAWRTIETGLRLMRSWPEAFEIFRKSPDFTDENLCLMLASMHQQTLHLMAHSTKGNWLLMEMCGAYTFASVFPEFRDSESIRRKAAVIIGEAIKKQTLPDGFHDELSPDYHSVVFLCGIKVIEQAKRYGRINELPDGFVSTLEHAADAFLAMATPNFTQPRTNDCYTMHTGKTLKKTGEIFPERPEFKWLLSKRSAGSPPAGVTASRYLPWAGYAIMRSDWGPHATYCCFDVGTLGKAHWHQDKLNINIYKGDEELLFDDGGGQYEISSYREYALSSADHNLVLVDGMGQTRPGPKRTNKAIDAQWVSTPKFDYACGIYSDVFGKQFIKPAQHKREVRFCKPDFFCVVDNLHSLDGNTHNYELLFQLDTLKMQKISEFPKALKSNFGKKYDILILPLFPEDIKISTFSGQKEPRMAGWYVGRNDQNLHPATTVIMKATKKQDFRFATLLFPMKKGDSLPKLEKIDNDCFKVQFNGKNTILNLKELSK